MEAGTALERRVERLAAEVRWTRRALGVAVLALVAAATAGSQSAAPPPGEVRATRFLLVDGKGAALAALEPAPDGSPRLRIGGAMGAAVTATTESGIPRVALSDKDGRDRLWMALRLGSPALQFLTPQGIARSGITTFNDDGGVAVVSAADGAKPGLVVYGKDRDIIWSAP